MALSFQEANAVGRWPRQSVRDHRGRTRRRRRSDLQERAVHLRQLFDTARGLDQTFIVYEDEEWTFAEVMEEVDALGYALVHHFGVKPGDRVGIAMRNYPEWIISFAAILSIGAISVSMNAWWTGPEMEYAINDAELSVMIGDTERIERGADACQRANVRDPRGAPGRAGAAGAERRALARRRRARCRDARGRTAARTWTPRSSTRRARRAFPRVRSRRTAPSVKRSSPSPRAPPSSVTLARGPRRPSGAGCRRVFILIVPLFHVTGCIPVMMSCFSFHLKLVMMYRWEPERALQLIERHQVTNFVGVPTQSWDLMESPHFASTTRRRWPPSAVAARRPHRR